MKYLVKILSILNHLTLSLGVVFLTFRVLDWYNPLMAFSTNMVSSWLHIVLCICAIIVAMGNRFLLRCLKKYTGD